MLRYLRYGYKGTYLQSQYLEAQEVNCFEFKTNLDGASLKIKPNQKVASTMGLRPSVYHGFQVPGHSMAERDTITCYL